MKMSGQANYGNWVPGAMMKMLWCASAGLGLISLLLVLLPDPVPGVIGLVLAASALCFTLYMQRCRNLFDFEGGDVMGEIHQFLVDHFPWQESRQAQGVTDGRSLILDIGCGAAALTNRVAKTWSNARLTGMDYWGAEWSYAKEQCEAKAKAEGVSDRVTFQKGDVAKLDFPDAAFDGAVSNFVFHEVRTAKDKRDVVREALRID